MGECFCLAYNKDMFDKFGVEYPTNDWTWDDLAENARKFAGGEGAGCYLRNSKPLD
ncbi:MAG: extracellular solute-binding protein [Fusicatenibacter saccharivorans]